MVNTPSWSAVLPGIGTSPMSLTCHPECVLVRLTWIGTSEEVVAEPVLSVALAVRK